MKTATLLAALIAVAAVTNAYAADPGPHAPGDPIKRGKYCWVNTDSKGNGWWDQCAAGSRFPHGVSEQDPTRTFAADLDGDGGGGGGGNGR